MALIHVLDTEGNSHLVHTSIFDEAYHRWVRSQAEWPGVWERVDTQPATPPASDEAYPL